MPCPNISKMLDSPDEPVYYYIPIDKKNIQPQGQDHTKPCLRVTAEEVFDAVENIPLILSPNGDRMTVDEAGGALMISVRCGALAKARHERALDCKDAEIKMLADTVDTYRRVTPDLRQKLNAYEEREAGMRKALTEAEAKTTMIEENGTIHTVATESIRCQEVQGLFNAAFSSSVRLSKERDEARDKCALLEAKCDTQHADIVELENIRSEMGADMEAMKSKIRSLEAQLEAEREESNKKGQAAMKEITTLKRKRDIVSHFVTKRTNLIPEMRAISPMANVPKGDLGPYPACDMSKPKTKSKRARRN